MRLPAMFADRLLLLLLSLTLCLPFLSFARYMPVPDWWSNVLVLMLLLPAFLLALWQKVDDDQQWSVRLPRIVPWLLFWWCLVFLPGSWRAQGSIYALALQEAGSILLLLVGACLLYGVRQRMGLAAVVQVLATVVLGGALLQALLGASQLFGLAPLANGWIMYDANAPTGNIMGNVAQRNQFAQVLSWGVLAAAYLWGAGRLRPTLALPLMLLLALVMAWSGGRLPLAYALGLVLVAGLYFWHGQARRLVWALLVAAACIVFMQFFGGEIAGLLTGKPALISGLDRFTEQGFGARRRIEMLKAWQIVQAYPWFGVGPGGYAYYSTWLEAFGGLAMVPESALFTHSHNLVAQLLAETGFPATILAALAVTLCLLPYMQKRHANAENAFLLLIGMTILIHSMFEYPLWYLPFLQAFFFVLVLSPWPEVTLAIRANLRRIGLLGLATGAVLYLVSGVSAFYGLVRTQGVQASSMENSKQIDTLLGIARNPFWSYEAEFMLSSFLVPSKAELAVKLRHYEQLVRYRPHLMLLTKLAMLRAWDGQAVAADQAIRMAIAAYPHYMEPVLVTLSPYQNDPVIKPLLRRVIKAHQVFKQSGPMAAAETVASRGRVQALP